jgi:hypothetical protein
MNKLFIGAFAISLSLNSYAEAVELKSTAVAGQECSTKVLNLVSQNLKVQKFNDSLVASACKKTTKGNENTIVALALNNDKESDMDASEQQKDLILALVNSDETSVIGSYKSVIEEDATLIIGSGSLKIDTARYDLTSEIRAFGVTFSSSMGNSSCAHGGWTGDSKSLYISEGAKIKKVLGGSTGLLLTSGNYVKDLDRCGEKYQRMLDKGYKDVVENFSTTISIGNDTANGFKDLILTSSSMYEIDEKKSKSKRKPLTVTLHFNGNEYPLDDFGKAESKWRWGK